MNRNRSSTATAVRPGSAAARSVMAATVCSQPLARLKALAAPIFSARAGLITQARNRAAIRAWLAAAPTSHHRARQRISQAATRIDPATYPAPDQLALARLMKAWVVTIRNGGMQKHSRVRSAAVSRLRNPSRASPPISTANGIGPNTPNCETRNSPSSGRLNSLRPPQAALAAVCCTVENPWAAFQARFGDRISRKAASAAPAVFQSQTLRASRLISRCRVSPIRA